jgi:APA family basic amino acid/polyamine antiporter
MVGLPLATWERLMIWLAIGMVVYFGYSRSRPRPSGIGGATAGVA